MTLIVFPLAGCELSLNVATISVPMVLAVVLDMVASQVHVAVTTFSSALKKVPSCTSV